MATITNDVRYDVLSSDRANDYLSFLNALDNASPYMHYLPGERSTTIHGMRSRLKKMEVQGNCFVMLALGLSGDIVGYFAVNGGNSKATKHSATIALGVLPSHHHQGVGAALLVRAEAISLTRDVFRFECTVVSSNQPAVRWYLNQGFKPCGVLHQRFYHGGNWLDEQVFEKLL